MKVTIFGAGAFGTALGSVLEENGNEVAYYDPIKYPGQSVVKSCEGSEASVLAVPSDVAPKLLLFVPHDRPLINASKGFLSMADFTPFGDNFSVISGGAFAGDLKAKKPGTILTATSDFAVSLFANSWLKFDRTTDNLGVMLCGTLKNIFAIGSGLWGLQYGTPDFDNFINTAIAETRVLLQYNGADPNTVNYACGLNDIVLTCASPSSRNYTCGTKLRDDPEYGLKMLRGEIKDAPTTEGITAARDIMEKRTTFKVPETGAPIFDRILHAAMKVPMPPLPPAPGN